MCPPRMLRSGVLFALLGLVRAVNDPKIYNVKQITSFGENAFPMFSEDGRFLYFQSKGKEYGTSCSRIYQMDLNNLKKEPISLYSTGLGDEFRPTVGERVSNEANTIVSTGIHWLKMLYDDRNQSITANSFCTPSKCDSPADADLQSACTNNPLDYTEHHDYTNLIQFDYNGILYGDLDMQQVGVNAWSNPLVKVSSQGYVGSKSCNTGECVVYIEYKIRRTATRFNQNGAAYDGFSYNPYKKYNPNHYFFFHGYTTTDEQKQRAIKKGVVPTEGSRIFRATWDQIINGDNPDEFVSSTDTFTYLWPQPTNKDNQVLATGIDPTTKNSGIYLLELGKDPVLLTDPSSNAYHATLDSTNQYITFVSNRNNGQNNIYMGKYLDSGIPDPSYYPSTPVLNKYAIAKPIKNFLCYKNPSLDTQTKGYKWTKLSSDGKLMYTRTLYYQSCPQIYIVDTVKNDTGVARKISTGFHAYNSPNFIKGTDNILFASTLTHKYDGNTMKMSDCRDDVCSYDNPEREKYPLSGLCRRVKILKSLPSDMEIYISNKYGAIQQRVTFHDGFDGEAAVSPDGKTVVYSSFIGNDYELFQIGIDGKNKKRLTNALGFEGGVTFSPDGKLIAYYASRPSSSNEISDYKQMMHYDFTDIAYTQIFVYSFDNNKEYQISNVRDMSCHSPTFMEKGSDKWSYRLVFVADKESSGFVDETNRYLHGAFLNTPKNSKLDSKVILIDDFYRRIWDLNVNGDSLAFSTTDDICVVPKFDFSSAFGAKISVSVLLLSFLLAKFL